jgi:uncharacterized membrane protein YccC
MHWYLRWSSALRRLHWERGLRAGIAVMTAMVVCRALGKPMGWAALGGFEAILVDNGGPYRSRLTTMLTVLVGGAIACVVATLSSTPFWLAVLVTAAFCFAVTFARVLANQIASTSVVILVLYFAGYGIEDHSFYGALGNALLYVLGGLWAAGLSVVLWPLDPFRPARLGVSRCYNLLAEFTSQVRATPPASSDRQAERHRMHELQRQMRLSIESARASIGSTGARITARTLRARSLAVLLETADLLFAGTIRWTELLESTSDARAQAAIADALMWLEQAEATIATALTQRPADGAASFAPEGSHSTQHLRKREAAIQTLESSSTPLDPLIRHLVQEERDMLLNVEVAFEAIQTLWSGAEAPTTLKSSGQEIRRSLLARQAQPAPGTGWQSMLEAARANWTTRSIMMRHALRMLIVGAVDVLLMKMVHVSHGGWLAMTSIIVLQPTNSGTLRRGLQRVGGTIAGGVLAAILAAAIHSQEGIIAVITVTSILTLATYAIDYGWYAFFLTPTFVLLSLPHLRDWHFAGVRIGNTILGAAVAVLAMRLLWPEREQLEMNRLLVRGAHADAEYVRAMLGFWSAVGNASTETARINADRTLLAPARRACGLAINDAEEALDRIMLEPQVPLSKGREWEPALTFVTYLRRMTRAVTTLASLGCDDDDLRSRAERVALRMERLADSMNAALEQKASSLPAETEPVDSPVAPLGEDTPAEHQLRRLERQAGVLERTAKILMEQNR